MGGNERFAWFSIDNSLYGIFQRVQVSYFWLFEILQNRRTYAVKVQAKSWLWGGRYEGKQQNIEWGLDEGHFKTQPK